MPKPKNNEPNQLVTLTANLVAITVFLLILGFIAGMGCVALPAAFELGHDLLD